MGVGRRRPFFGRSRSLEIVPVDNRGGPGRRTGLPLAARAAVERMDANSTLAECTDVDSRISGRLRSTRERNCADVRRRLSRSRVATKSGRLRKSIQIVCFSEIAELTIF